jgi:hypothetical protein
MRALKSVLVMAGSLKRADPDLLEDIVLIRAMRDSNIPKFLSEVRRRRRRYSVMIASLNMFKAFQCLSQSTTYEILCEHTHNAHAHSCRMLGCSMPL